jgi:uncharacterized protein YcfJ
MKKRLAIATLLSTALLASPVTQAASYQDRAMTTGAVVGATSGAIIGSNSNQAIEGAIFGAVLGTIAGAIIASNNQPVTVVHTQRRPVVEHHVYHQPRPVVQHRVVYTHHRPVVQRHVYRDHRPAHRVSEHRTYDRHDRHVAQKDSRARKNFDRHDPRRNERKGDRDHRS